MICRRKGVKNDEILIALAEHLGILGGAARLVPSLNTGWIEEGWGMKLRRGQCAGKIKGKYRKIQWFLQHEHRHFGLNDRGFKYYKRFIRVPFSQDFLQAGAIIFQFIFISS